MNSVFSARKGVMDDLCFRIKQPVVEKEHSDLEVVIGIPKMTGNSAAFFSKIIEHFLRCK